MTEGKMVGWHHQLNGHEFEQALSGGDGQGGLACCSPGGGKESDTTEGLNNNNKFYVQEYAYKFLKCINYLITVIFQIFKITNVFLKIKYEYQP